MQSETFFLFIVYVLKSCDIIYICHLAVTLWPFAYCFDKLSALVCRNFCDLKKILCGNCQNALEACWMIFQTLLNILHN